MSRLDVYLRSIKQLGALGAVLTSGQAVTLRFPTGDRHATQITAHDQLVSLVREIAPPVVVEQIDRARPASFELEASGGRWSIQVVPRPGAWHVAIDPIEAPAAPPPGPPMRPTPWQRSHLMNSVPVCRQIIAMRRVSSVFLPIKSDCHNHR